MMTTTMLMFGPRLLMLLLLLYRISPASSAFCSPSRARSSSDRRIFDYVQDETATTTTTGIHTTAGALLVARTGSVAPG